MRFLTVDDCPVCRKVIWKTRLVQANFWIKKVPYEQNKHGRHFWILQTDGSRMQVAICNDCFAALTDAIVKQIFADITYTKLEQLKTMSLSEDKKYLLFDRIRSIEVWKWFGTEAEVVAYLKEQDGSVNRSK